MNDFDDIDRALFALPLETPPADLRARILAATVHAPVAVTGSAFRPLDIALLCGLLILLVGTVVASLSAPGAAIGAASTLVRAWAALGNPSLWVWLGVGGSIAGWLLLVDLFPARPRLRAGH